MYTRIVFGEKFFNRRSSMYRRRNGVMSPPSRTHLSRHGNVAYKTAECKSVESTQPVCIDRPTDRGARPKRANEVGVKCPCAAFSSTDDLLRIVASLGNGSLNEQCRIRRVDGTFCGARRR